MKKRDIPIVNEQIIPIPLEEMMHNSMIPYAEHVIMERAVPRVEDGLKPVQRRILFAMLELGITPQTPHRKCARIVGDCLGKFHPHGDSSVYDALVRLAQPFSMRAPLIDGHGNFGSIDGDSAAAMRYTEARMTPLAMEMLKDIDKDTVPFRLNFDDTIKEPDMLPASYPNLLVNGSSGIAVGLATNIPPHNLGECIDAVVAQIDNPDITLEELMQYIPAPDFPTGGLLMNTPSLKQAYQTGKGKLLLRAKTHIEDGIAGRKCIVITELPYQVNKANMLEKILKLSEEKKAYLGNIHDIRDESDRTGMRAIIELKRDSDVDKTLSYLFKYSDLQVTFGVNMVAIADGKPKLLSLKKVIKHYIRHRKNVITARTQYNLDRANARLHIVNGLMIAVNNLQEVLELIIKSENPKAAKLGLMERFELTEIQAQAILDLRLQRLTGLEILALRKEFESLTKEIAILEGILNSEKKLLGVIKKELQQVSKEHSNERRTLLVNEDEVVTAVDKEEIIERELTVTYFDNDNLRVSPVRPVKKTEAEKQEEDNIRFVMDTTSLAIMYFFTNLGNCYTLPVVNIPESTKPKDKGQTIRSLLAGLEENEKIIYLTCCQSKDMPNLPDLLFITEKGVLKRTKMAQYEVRRQKFIAISFKENDLVNTILPLDETEDLLLITKNGMSIRFHTDNIPTMGRVATGVIGIKLAPKDSICHASQPKGTDQIILMSETGFAKRLLFMDFEPQARSGKGVKCFTFNKNKTNGTQIVFALVCNSGQSIKIYQKISPPTIILSDTIPLQSKPDSGVVCVLAIMEDFVEKGICL